ncbi:MAG: ClbS/DfsB family four-helix bundle protein [Ktedonobacterales bacterium]
MSLEVTRALLLERIRTSQTHWDALLTEVPAARMTEPGVEGEWSIKDIIAHVAIYEQWTADQLEAARRGETQMVTRPNLPPGANTFDTHARNAAYFHANRDRPLGDIMAEARAEHARLLAAVEALPEDALPETSRFEWTGGTRVWEMVAANSYDHHAEHGADIRAWLAAQ